jgi:peptidoglycan/xylan/chitin deacetylase (PgdA/CDA1 family)
MMRERLRLIVAAFFYYSGLVRLALWWQQRSEQKLLILNYHRAEGNIYAQLDYLQRHYRILHLEDALEELYAPDRRVDRSAHDHRTPLVLTFDDGYLDNYHLAWMIAKQLHIPITIFVIPGYVESGAYFWWLAGAQLASQVQGEEVSLYDKAYALSLPGERNVLAHEIDKRLRYASTVNDRDALLVEMQQQLGVVLPARGQETYDDAGVLPMTWDQIREMEASGQVSFGAHTMNHPVLAYLSEASEVFYEVGEARVKLEQELGHAVRSFAYPIGKIQHIQPYGQEAVNAAGFTWAVTTLEDINTSQTDPYLLARLPGDTELHWLIMASELVGLLGVVSRVRKKYAKLFKK